MPQTVGSARLGCLLVLAATLCWSLNAPFVKYLTVPALLICAMRSLLGGLLLLPFLVKGEKIAMNRWTAMYLAGFAGVSALVVASLHLTNSAIAVGMQYTALVWLVVISVIRRRTWKGEPWRQALLVFIGLVLFMASGDGGTMLGNFLAFLSGIALAMLNVGSSRAGNRNPLGLTCVGCLLLGSILILVIPGSFTQVANFTGTEWFFLLMLGLFPVATGYGTYNLALRHVRPQVGSLLASFEMLIAPLWVALFVGEEADPLVLTGLAFIFAGVVWCAFEGVRKEGARERA